MEYITILRYAYVFIFMVFKGLEHGVRILVSGQVQVVLKMFIKYPLYPG